MGRHTMRSRCMSAALSTVISVCLVMGMLPQSAFADDSSLGGEPQAPNEQFLGSGAQISQEVTLAKDVEQEQKATTLDASKETSNSVKPESAGDQVTAEVKIGVDSSTGVSSAESLLIDGYIYALQPDEQSVSLTGWYGTAPKGEVVIPSTVQDGKVTYSVTAIARPDQGSVGIFSTCVELKAITLPSSIAEIDTAALSGCTSLSSIMVSDTNAQYATSNGMLFTKDLKQLLLVPEGKEGAARIPDQTEQIAASAFSHCAEISSILVGSGSASFSSRSGVLYTKDMKTLISCAPKSGASIVVPLETVAIGPDAFAGCLVESLIVQGSVQSIAGSAFSGEVKANAMVALIGGNDYEARKVIWATAGFVKFQEPAKPGDSTELELGIKSGFVYTMQSDMTLEVTWVGEAEPETNLVIPASAEIDGVVYRVSTIAPHAFEGASFGTLVVPATIVSIGDFAFAGCAMLTSVKFDEGLVSLGKSAFEASAIGEVVLPTSLSMIEDRAFADCLSLNRVIALSDIDVISSSAIEGCAGLSVLVPYQEDGAYLWNVGIFALGNHVSPYGITLPKNQINLQVDQVASLFEDGFLEAPDACDLEFSYTASSVAVDSTGLITGKKAGTAEIVGSVVYEDKVLARSECSAKVEGVLESLGGDANAADFSGGSTDLTSPVMLEAAYEGAQINTVAALGTTNTFEQKVSSGQ
ncbi:MAG: leucine-rich repeat protein, partial [Raoultibacter sp.]